MSEFIDVQRRYAKVILLFLGVVLLLAPLVARPLPRYVWPGYALAWLVWWFLPWKA
jgi:hypothetical protein